MSMPNPPSYLAQTDPEAHDAWVRLAAAQESLKAYMVEHGLEEVCLPEGFGYFLEDGEIHGAPLTDGEVDRDQATDPYDYFDAEVSDMESSASAIESMLAALKAS